jgi:pilus assembly protein Flp/PilA
MLGLITRLQTRVTDVNEFCQDKSGATAIEYGLIAAGIAVAIIAAVFALGDEVKGFFEDIQTQLGSGQPKR